MTDAQTEAPVQPKAGKGVQTVTVAPDEDGMRLDRFFEARFPGLSFSHIQRIIRKGEVRVNGKRAQPKDRLQKGQAIRIPPLKIEPPEAARRCARAARRTAPSSSPSRSTKDDDVLVLNKPMGLAVQGGSGTYRILDGMLGLHDRQGRPAAAPRAPARQGHLGLPPGRQDPLCRDCACQRPSAPARPARSTGRWSRRAAAEAGPGFDLPRQGRPRGREHDADRQATATTARATR
jgi:ribosomal 50S subunit-recycling heat shock protein